jgi:hypothetical protein
MVLKSSGAAWNNHFAQSITNLGFINCQPSPNVWRRPAIKNDGNENIMNISYFMLTIV